MRTGIVAVHGVTPQPRYGFQDDVARRLMGALNDREGIGVWSMGVVLPKPSTVSEPDPSPSDIATISRVYQSKDSIENPKGDCFDVHEAYWSPIDKGKTNAVSIGYWLLRTLFLPINDTARFIEAQRKIFFDISYVVVAAVLAATLLIGSAMLAVNAIQSAASIASTCKPAPDVSTHGTFEATLTKKTATTRSGIGSFSVALPTCTPPDAPSWNPISALSAALKPLTLVGSLPGVGRVVLVLGAIGGFVLAQALRAMISFFANLPRLSVQDPVQRTSRIRVVGALFVLGAALLVPLWRVPMPSGQALGAVGGLVVGAALLFQGARLVLGGFFVAFLGDVQIYTTRDQNSDFYALREQILEVVASKIRYVLATSPSGVSYDRVHVLAHSLGSSVAMDAILRLSNRRSEDPALAVAWGKMRSFVSFGTSLEKAKYFFNAWSPTPSQGWMQWSDAVYGSLFTRDRNALLGGTASGIYWLNCWYFTDFVADEIGTYRSYGRAGRPPSDSLVGRAHARALARRTNLVYAGRLVAENRTTRGPLIPRGWCVQTHTHYLDHDWFWKKDGPGDIGALDVLLVESSLPPHCDVPPIRIPPILPHDPVALEAFSLTPAEHSKHVDSLGFDLASSAPGSESNLRTWDTVRK